MYILTYLNKATGELSGRYIMDKTFIYLAKLFCSGISLTHSVSFNDRVKSDTHKTKLKYWNLAPRSHQGNFVNIIHIPLTEARKVVEI